MTKFFNVPLRAFFKKQDLVIAFVEKALLCNICAFILFSPFSAVFSKISFFWSVIFWISLTILQYKSRFYLHLIPKTTLNKSLFLFLAAAVISVLFSVDLYHSQKILFQRYFFYAIFFWISYAVVSRSPRNIFYLVFSILVLGTTLGIGGLVDYFRFSPERLFSVFSRGVNLSVYLCFFIPFGLVLFLSKTKKSFKVLSLVSIVLLYLVLVLHASRTVWIIIIPVLLTVCFLKDKKVFLLFLTLVIATMIFMPNFQKDRVKTLLYVFEAPASNEAKDPGKQPYFGERIESLYQRIDLANSAIAIFIKHPIFGSGPGMFEKLHKPGPRCDPHIHVHIMYLEILAEMGLVGLLAFSIIIFIFFRKFTHYFKFWLKNNSPGNSIFMGAGLAIFTALICNFGISSILVGFQDALMFWFFMAIAVNEKIFDENVS